MHHIKSDARGLAYTDTKNPFSRPVKRRGKSMTNQLEDGTAGAVTKTQTSPADTRPGHNQSFSGSQSTKQTTLEQTGITSTGAEYNIQRTMSPQATESLTNEKRTESDDTSQTRIPAPWTADGETSAATSQADKEKKPLNRLMSKFSHKKDKKGNDDYANDKTKKHFTLMGQLRATIFGSWVNILLVCCPIGIALHYANVSPVAVFVTNFIAIIPLAGMLSYATEEIAYRTGEVLGGLLNATFGNAVELIVSIIALFQNQFLIVQTSLLGSMLSNLLLVMGMCFFAGGYNRFEQAFNITVAQTAASLLFLAVACLIIPTAFEAYATPSNDQTVANQTPLYTVTELSRGTAVILLFIYGCYLFFQLKSHTNMYTEPGEKHDTRFTAKDATSKVKNGARHVTRHRRGSKHITPGTELTTLADNTSVDESASPNSDRAPHSEDVDNEKKKAGDDEEVAQLSLTGAILTLLGSTVLVALNAEYLVDAINAITCKSNGISKNFVGLILLPIVGNAAEHATAVTVAIKDKMDLAIGVAVGSSLQIALLVLPLTVVIGWIAHKDDMTLYFDGFQLIMLFVAILLVNYLIQDGKSHWLEGILLMCLYVIIAVAAWFYPTSAEASGC